MIVKIIFLIKSIPRSDNNITSWQSYDNKLVYSLNMYRSFKTNGYKKSTFSMVHFHDLFSIIHLG